MLGLAGPDELRVDMGVVSIDLLALIPIGFRRYQTDGRVVRTLLIGVRVAFNVFLFRHGVQIGAYRSDHEYPVLPPDLYDRLLTSRDCTLLVQKR